MDQVETLIHAAWVIPVEPDGSVHERHSLAIRGGRIVEVLPRAEAEARFRADTVVDLAEHAIIPGLVNTHTHAAMALLRGLADDLPLMEWLNGHIWPAEQAWVSAELVRDGTRLAVAEMLRGGTTCFNDMYFFPDAAGNVADDAGIRAVVGLIVIDFPTVWAGEAQEYLEKGLEVHDQFRDHPYVSTAFAPHAPYTVADEPLQKIATLAEELDLPVHMHVHETADEVAASLKQFGKRPLERLEALGLLSPHLLGVHMTQLQDDEIPRLARAGVHVVHCPESNLKLASGFCPVAKLVDEGVNVALGTDGAASNNDLDMFGEMRTAALLAKAVSGDASSIAALTALRMATLNGAKALGLEEETGSLAAGKSADLVAVHLGGVETCPLYNPVSQIVYAAGREHVTDVWVGGKHVLKDRVLTTLDVPAVLSDAREWAKRIAARNGGGTGNPEKG